MGLKRKSEKKGGDQGDRETEGVRVRGAVRGEYVFWTARKLHTVGGMGIGTLIKRKPQKNSPAQRERMKRKGDQMLALRRTIENRTGFVERGGIPARKKNHHGLVIKEVNGKRHAL